MSETENKFDMPEEEPSEERPFPWVAVIVGILLFGIAAAWIWHEKSQGKARAEAVAALEQELTADEAVLQAQKDKVVQISQQLDALKLKIQTGKASDAKKATDEYNALAKQQNDEREKYLSMANDYNAKVATYKQQAE